MTVQAGNEMALSSTTLASLSAMPGRLEAAFRLVPRERWNFTPASWEGCPGETLPPVGQICHIRDIEVDGYHVRISRMLQEVEPALVSLDGYELAKERSYATADPARALADFRAARARTVALLTGLSAAQCERRGSFGEYGSVTLRSLVHYLASHDFQHLACMDWLLGQIFATGEVSGR